MLERSAVIPVNTETHIAYYNIFELNVYNVQEKGTTPLHVAARAGQAFQVELLIANGANASVVDSNGQIAADIAK